MHDTTHFVPLVSESSFSCGHTKNLTPEHAEQVVDFVKQWRAKVFCICLHIRAELKMKVSLAIFLEPSTGTCHLSVMSLRSTPGIKNLGCRSQAARRQAKKLK